MALWVAVLAPNVAAQAPDYVAADARFMRAMIAHHAQAVGMAELVAARSDRRDLTVLAERIAVGQTVEIRMMRRWLIRRNEPLVADHDGHDEMPGMIPGPELEALTGLSGVAFERRFLELMIRHHEGAIVMVERLFAMPGAGREPALWEFASDVEKTQRAEIDQMRRMGSP